MKRRLFIAINLPENIKNKLIGYQRKWADLPVRWTWKANLHITLVFIGYVGDNEMYEICNIAKMVARRHNPFNINLERIILGPASAKDSAGRPPRFPRMFWVEGKKSEEMAKLKNDFEDMLMGFGNSGYRKKEARAYHPHITLGRIKQGQWRELSSQPEIDEKFNFTPHHQRGAGFSFLVETVEVMQSDLQRTGPEYTVLESVTLG